MDCLVEGGTNVDWSEEQGEGKEDHCVACKL